MKQVILFLTCILVSTNAFSQVWIGTENPDASAVLDLTSTTKGLLPPRMIKKNRNTIINPTAGLILYCTDCGNGEMQVYNGDDWVASLSTPISSAGLLSVTEGKAPNENTGYRRADAVADNYGDIGLGAVDLSFSILSSSTSGATGDYSTAMGTFTTASGDGSTAMGSNTIASGVYSTAMGVESSASGDGSTAMGALTKASGKGSTAMGAYIIASDFGSVVLGQYNNRGSSEISADSFDANAPAFVIGNGTSLNDKSDAFMVDFSGNITIGAGVYLAGIDSDDTGKILVLDGETGAIVPTLFPIASETDMGLVSTEAQTFGGDKNFNGTITASMFSGDGSELTNLPSSAGLMSITEDSRTGYRRADAPAGNYGAIGLQAVDLSFSGAASSTYGATGDNAFATGSRTTASGIGSTAMGILTTASGIGSTAIGSWTIASDYGSVVLGQYNNRGSTATSANSFNLSAPAFVIGNGNSAEKNDAFVVDFSGNVTAAMFIGDGSLLTDLPTGGLMSITEDSNTGFRRADAPPANYGDIGAGAVDLSFSGEASSTYGATGNGAFATGARTIASGIGSTAMGTLTIASGIGSTAMGTLTTAMGNNSTAMGVNTTASYYGSVVMGQYNSAGSEPTGATSFSASAPAFVIGNGSNSTRSDAFVVDFSGNVTAADTITATAFIGDGSLLTDLPIGGLMSITEGSNTGYRRADAVADNYGTIGSGAVDLSASVDSEEDSNFVTYGATGENSTAMGNVTTASGPYSTAMGNNTTASGYNSTAIGRTTTASGRTSTAMGSGTTAKGDISTAMGNGTTASDYGSVVLGQYNNRGSSEISADTFNADAPAFVIGNGTSLNDKSDAFVVDFSGNITIGAGVYLAGIDSDDTGKILVLDGETGAIVPTLFPIASETDMGLVSTEAQTFGGDKNFTGDVKATRYVLTAASGISASVTTKLDLSTGNVLTVNLNANITPIELENPAVGTYLIKFIQDGTGGRTVSFPTTNWKWSGGIVPVVTETANSTDIVTLIYDGENYYAAISQNF